MHAPACFNFWRLRYCACMRERECVWVCACVWLHACKRETRMKNENWNMSTKEKIKKRKKITEQSAIRNRPSWVFVNESGESFPLQSRAWSGSRWWRQQRCEAAWTLEFKRRETRVCSQNVEQCGETGGCSCVEASFGAESIPVITPNLYSLRSGHRMLLHH